MGFFWSAARKDLARLGRDRVALLLWLGIPLVIGAVITLAFGGRSGPRPTVHLLVVDEDDSFLSHLLARGPGGEMGRLLRVEEVERKAGMARLEAGDASALLVVPAGFGRAVLEEQPTTLRLYTNPAQRILPGIVEQGLSLLVDGTFYLHRVLGREIKEIVHGPPGGGGAFADAEVARLSVSINAVMKRLARYLFPPVVELATVTAAARGERGDFGVLFLPGLVLMALFFSAQGLAEDVWRERRQGTLRRVLTTPRLVSVFLGAKVAAGGVVVTGIAAVTMGLGAAYFRIAAPRALAGLGWAALTGGVLLVLMTALQLFAATQRAGALLATSVMFPLLMIGGSFFPFEAMPAWMAAVGRWTPNGWALEQLKGMLLGRQGPGSVAVAAAGLVAVGGAVFLLCAWRLRAVFARR